MEGLKHVENFAVILVDLPSQGNVHKKLLEGSRCFSLFDDTSDLIKFTYIRLANVRSMM